MAALFAIVLDLVPVVVMECLKTFLRLDFQDLYSTKEEMSSLVTRLNHLTDMITLSAPTSPIGSHYYHQYFYRDLQGYFGVILANPAKACQAKIPNQDSGPLEKQMGMPICLIPPIAFQALKVRCQVSPLSIALATKDFSTM